MLDVKYAFMKRWGEKWGEVVWMSSGPAHTAHQMFPTCIYLHVRRHIFKVFSHPDALNTLPEQLRLSVVSHLHILQSCVSHCVSACEALVLRVVFAAGQRRNFCGSRLSLISSERGGWWYQGSRWMGDKLGLMVEEMPFRSQTIMLLAQHNRYTHLLLPPLLSLSLIPSSWCNLLLMFLHSF